MKTKLVIFILAAGVCTLSAQPQERERGQRGNQGPGAMFDRADANKDDFVDLKELTAFRESMQQAQGGNRGRGAPNTENLEAPEGETTRPPRGGNSNQQGQGARGQRGPREMPSAEVMLKTMGKDEDGKISREEFSMGNQRQGRGPGRGQGQGQGRGPAERAKAPE